MCMGIVPACMSAYRIMPSGHEGQKRVLDSLELELQKTVKPPCRCCESSSFSGLLDELPFLQPQYILAHNLFIHLQENLVCFQIGLLMNKYKPQVFLCL